MVAIDVYGTTVNTDNPEYIKAIESSKKALDEATELFASAHYKSKDGWKKREDANGVKIYSYQAPFGKVYSITFELDGSLAECLDEYWHKMEGVVEWNKNFEKIKIIENFGETARIVQALTRDILVVKGREFLGCGVFKKNADGTYFFATRSFESSTIPLISPGHKRANCIISGGRLTAVGARKTLAEMLYCVDLGDLKLPKGVVSQAIVSMSMTDAVSAKKHAAKKYAS